MPSTSRALRLVLVLILLLLGVSLSSTVQAEKEEIVSFNTDTQKYHCLTCQWAIKCTKNCVKMKRSDAEEKGVPCKVCHGSCEE